MTDENVLHRELLYLRQEVKEALTYGSEREVNNLYDMIAEVEKELNDYENDLLSMVEKSA